MTTTRAMNALCFAVLPLAAMAGTCQAEDGCYQSSAASRSLLQSGASTQQQRKALQTAVSKQMEAMVGTLLVNGAEEVGAFNGSIETIRTAILEESIPSIMDGHKDDQEEMDLALDLIKGCNTDFEESSEESGEKLADQLAKKPDGTCRADQESLAGQNKTNWQVLVGYVDGFQVPAKPEGVLGLDAWFSSGETLFEAAVKEYPTKEATYKEGKEAWLLKKTSCDEEQETFEKSYCAWYGHATDAISDYDKCWDEKSKFFDRDIKIILHQAETRKAQYVSAKKILCYLNVLEALAESTEAIAKDVMAGAEASDSTDYKAELEKCNDLSIDTDQFDISNTEKPAEMNTDLGVSGGASVECL